MKDLADDLRSTLAAESIRLLAIGMKPRRETAQGNGREDVVGIDRFGLEQPWAIIGPATAECLPGTIRRMAASAALQEQSWTTGRSCEHSISHRDVVSDNYAGLSVATASKHILDQMAAAVRETSVRSSISSRLRGAHEASSRQTGTRVIR